MKGMRKHMHEIDRILAELDKNLDEGVCVNDMFLIKQALVKAAYAAVIDGGVALSVCSYVEASQKKQEK